MLKKLRPFITSCISYCVVNNTLNSTKPIYISLQCILPWMYAHTLSLAPMWFFLINQPKLAHHQFPQRMYVHLMTKATKSRISFGIVQILWQFKVRQRCELMDLLTKAIIISLHAVTGQDPLSTKVMFCLIKISTILH